VRGFTTLKALWRRHHLRCVSAHEEPSSPGHAERSYCRQKLSRHLLFAQWPDGQCNLVAISWPSATPRELSKSEQCNCSGAEHFGRYPRV
jgi:hypothetical protein